MLMRCSLDAYLMLIGCSLDVSWMRIGCSLDAHWMLIGCSKDVHYIIGMLNEFPNTLWIPIMLNGCPLDVC